MGARLFQSDIDDPHLPKSYNQGVDTNYLILNITDVDMLESIKIVNKRLFPAEKAVGKEKQQTNREQERMCIPDRFEINHV